MNGSLMPAAALTTPVKVLMPSPSMPPKMPPRKSDGLEMKNFVRVLPELLTTPISASSLPSKLFVAPAGWNVVTDPLALNWITKLHPTKTGSLLVNGVVGQTPDAATLGAKPTPRPTAADPVSRIVESL